MQYSEKSTYGLFITLEALGPGRTELINEGASVSCQSQLWASGRLRIAQVITITSHTWQKHRQVTTAVCCTPGGTQEHSPRQVWILKKLGSQDSFFLGVFYQALRNVLIRIAWTVFWRWSKRLELCWTTQPVLFIIHLQVTADLTVLLLCIQSVELAVVVWTRMAPIEAHIFEGLVPSWWTCLGWLGKTIMMEEVCG